MYYICLELYMFKMLIMLKCLLFIHLRLIIHLKIKKIYREEKYDEILSLINLKNFTKIL